MSDNKKFKVVPTEKKSWHMHYVFEWGGPNDNENSFSIEETYRSGYAIYHAEIIEKAKDAINYSEDGCLIEDWDDTDNEDLSASHIYDCRGCSAEELEKEFEDHYWDFGQIYEKYGEPVKSFKQITGLAKITEE
jgi:hypothetical protein